MPTAFRTYKQTLLDLKNGTAPTTLPAVKCLLLPDGLTGGETPAQVYARIQSGYFNPDMLYFLLQDTLRDTLKRDQLTYNHSTLAWPGAYAAEATLVAYQRTRNTQFLDLFVTYQDEVNLRRDDYMGHFDKFHNRVMKAWSSIELINSGETVRLTHVTNAARIVYPGTLFAKIVSRNATLKVQYQTKADYYVKVAVESMNEFESDWKRVPGYSGVSWYFSAYKLSIEATNHVHQAGAVWLNLAALTNDAKYAARVNYAIKIFMKGVKKDPTGAVYWNYFPYFAKQEMKRYPNGQEYSEFVWKASLTAPFLLRAYQQGYSIPAYVIDSITKTFATVTFSKQGLMRNVSPKNSRYFDPGVDGKQLTMAQNVVTLVEFQTANPVIGTRIASLVAKRPDIWPEGWMTGTHGMLAYAQLLPRTY